MTEEEKRKRNREQCAKYYAANRDKFKAYKQEYYLKNSEKLKARERKAYAKRVKLWKEFLRERVSLMCVKCGYDRCFAALEFHHVKPRIKEHTISKLIKRAFTENRKLVTTKELTKCIILCSNCHRELHAKFVAV